MPVKNALGSLAPGFIYLTGDPTETVSLAGQAFLSVMRQQHKWYVYVEIRSLIDNKGQWGDLSRKLRQYGYSPWEIALIGALGRFRPGIGLARIAINTFRSIQFLFARVRRRTPAD